MKTTTTALCVALLFVAIASALPSHWRSFYDPAAELFARKQQQQCKVEDATIGCRTARLVHSNGHYSHVHICPVDSCKWKMHATSHALTLPCMFSVRAYIII